MLEDPIYNQNNTYYENSQGSYCIGTDVCLP
jgi:hypothetical protein